jgi:hypothetical protein
VHVPGEKPDFALAHVSDRVCEAGQPAVARRTQARPTAR